MSESHVNAVPPTTVADAFTSAAITAFQELTQIDVFPDPSLSPAAAEPPGPVVSAVIRLQRLLPGTMSLVLTEDAASQLAARYLPQGTLLTDEMIDDVAGEFANVIAGQAKTILKGSPYHFTMSTPSVARAASLTELPSFPAARLVTSLPSDLGQALLLIDLPPCPDA